MGSLSGLRVQVLNGVGSGAGVGVSEGVSDGAAVVASGVLLVGALTLDGEAVSEAHPVRRIRLHTSATDAGIRLCGGAS